MLKKLLCLPLVLLAFSFGPISMYLLSLNTLPNEPFYNLKRNYEALATLATVKSYPLNSQVQLVLLDRRANETLTLVKTSSSDGFKLLIDQAGLTQKTLNRQPNHPNSQLYQLHFSQIIKSTTTSLFQIQTSLLTQFNPNYIPPQTPQGISPEDKAMLSYHYDNPGQPYQALSQLTAPPPTTPTPTPLPSSTSSQLIEQISQTIETLQKL